MSKQKKTLQLGMNPSTASGRLVKDTLFKLAIEAGYACYRCSKPLTRDTFSIEHKEPWLDSEDPVGTFFDQDNIAFSHLTCNVRESRGSFKKEIPHGTSSGYDYHKCRCNECKTARRNRLPYDSDTRREKYLRTGN